MSAAVGATDVPVNGDASGPIKIEEHLFGSSEQYLDGFASTLRATQSKLPQLIEIRSSAVFDSGIPQQDIKPRTADLELDKIAEHILEQGLILPVRSKVTQIGNSMNRAQARLFGAIELMEHRMAENDADDKALIGDAMKECEQVLESIDELSEGFDNDIRDLIQNMDRTLDIDHIIHHASDLQQYVNRERRLQGLEQWIAPWREKALDWWKNFMALVVQRKRDEARTAFEHKFKHLEDPFSQIQGHLAQIALPAEIEQELPFHYKQLFRGKHASLGRNPLAFNDELNSAMEAIKRSKEGSSGAIMVIGSSMSGRSYFCEHLAANALGGQVYAVEPTAIEGGARRDLTMAFANALDMSGSLDDMLNQCSAGSVFLLNDVERWWLRSDTEHKAIDRLSALIQKHGARHYFLLNCCRHSFELICDTSELESALISTIHLAPVSIEEMRNIIRARHQSSGLGVLFRGREVDLERSNVPSSWARRAHSISGGNTGLALASWLRSITAVEHDRIVLDMPDDLTFPDLSDHIWKGLVYQFVLHHTLSKEDVFSLFEDHSKEQIIRTLGNMKRSGLLTGNDDDTLTLNNEQRSYIEQWMTRLEILQ